MIKLTGNLNKPFVVSTSVLGAGAHGKASGQAANLEGHEMIGAFANVFSPSMTDQAQVRAAAIVYRTGVVYCQGERNLNSAPLGKYRTGVVQIVCKYLCLNQPKV